MSGVEAATNPDALAMSNVILRAVVGSTAHGLAVEGTDDHDEMAVCVEPPDYVIGLRHFANHGTYLYRTAEERKRHDPEADQRYHGRAPASQAGDLDLVVHSLRKFARLAAGANPSILILLFAEPLEAHVLGRELQASADMFASKLAGKTFLGYLRAQRERLLGRRGQMRVTRTDLIERHGYDSKYAMHAARLGFQGFEYLDTGRLTLPMPGPERQVCMGIRRGEWDLDAVIRLLSDLEEALESLHRSSTLPQWPDYDRINSFLVRAYRDWWWPASGVTNSGAF